MMASRPFASSAPYGLIDFAVPALAGFAVVFIAFAAPVDLLEGAVAASGLPSLIAGAAPPLGGKARILLGLGGGAAVFALAFALLRLIDRLTARPPRAVPVLVEEPAPRVRRRDFHPDAPPRPPVSAIREFGEPAPPRAPRAASGDRPIATIVGEEAMPAPQPEFAADQAPEPAPAGDPASEPAPAASPSRADSLADLMARLERGLVRRAAARRPAAPRAAPQVFPDRSDDRLASAIESLQRLAAARRG